MMRKIRNLALALAIVGVMIPVTASAHGSMNHHSCGNNVLHGKVFDGSSGGKYWYHAVGQTSSVWPFAEFDYVYYHYYRAGPPSAPVYIYDHYNRITCW